MNLHEEKSILRKSIATQRDALSAGERQEKDRQIHENLRQIPDFNQAKSVFCYISYLTEVETHSLIKHWLTHNIRIAVPKIIDKTIMHSVILESWENLEPDRLGILTPQSDEIATGPFDIAITPGLAFTIQGARLGYGRGYYDRWFAKNDVKKKIGVCYEEQVLEQLPTESTDITIDLVVTNQPLK